MEEKIARPIRIISSRKSAFKSSGYLITVMEPVMGLADFLVIT